jgi:hypothetical protein
MQVLLADTTPLMTAIYSEYYFGDCSLYPMAWAQQAKCDAHLLMGLDLTWQADGHWRDGPPVQKAVDALLRERLQTAGLRYHTVYGQGQQRVAAAWTAIELLFLSKKSSKNRAINPINKSGRHDFYSKNLLECTECAHPESERALFSRLLQTRLTASPPPSASALVPAAVSAPMHLPPPQTLPPLT